MGTLGAEGIDVLVRSVDAGGPAALIHLHGGIGAAGDRHRQGQGRQAGAQHHGAHASASPGVFRLSRCVQLLGQGMSVALGGGSHGETSFQSTAGATVVEQGRS